MKINCSSTRKRAEEERNHILHRELKTKSGFVDSRYAVTPLHILLATMSNSNLTYLPAESILLKEIETPFYHAMFKASKDKQKSAN